MNIEEGSALAPVAELVNHQARNPKVSGSVASQGVRVFFFFVVTIVARKGDRLIPLCRPRRS